MIIDSHELINNKFKFNSYLAAYCFNLSSTKVLTYTETPSDIQVVNLVEFSFHDPTRVHQAINIRRSDRDGEVSMFYLQNVIEALMGKVI